MGGGPSVPSADTLRLDWENQNLRKENEALKKAIEEIKKTNVYLKGALVAIPISLLGVYGLQKFFGRSDLLPGPWRKIHQTLIKVPEMENDFRRQILEMRPRSDTTLNILLLGQVGSGKSSFVNACYTALLPNEGLKRLAVDGEMASESITQKLLPYKLYTKKIDLPVLLFDCRGLFEGDKGVQTEDIKKICRGNIKAEYLIDPKRTIQPGDTKYCEEAQEKDKIHCIVYVLAANEDGFVKKEVAQQLKEIRELFRKDIPQLILLTKIDLIGIDDITQIFRHKRVKECCERAASFLKFCVNDVFPQLNYSNEVVPCDYKDLITMFNIKTIMERANDRVNGLI